MRDAQNEAAKVTEIVVADGLLFVLCQSGICTAFNRGKHSDYVSLRCAIHGNHLSARFKAPKLRLLPHTSNYPCLQSAAGACAS
jgi:hypothetical protein